MNTHKQVTLVRDTKSTFITMGEANGNDNSGVESHVNIKVYIT